tara:strand:+ start:380 stop:688 length:309 start_codon:yes stop_codon:yes gene_type:complete
MANVARMGDSVNTGHGCDTIVEILGGDVTVLVEGKPVAVQSSALEPHTITNPSAPPACIPHPGQIINAGSGTVIVGGKGIARVGDSADLGSISTGSRTVIAG